MTSRIIPLAALVLTLLTGCSEPDLVLPGERLDLRAGTAGEPAAEVNRALSIALPSAQVNTAFSHRGGSAQHLLPHPALGASLTQVFSVPIGRGDSRQARITADPVVADGRVFAMDSGTTVSAHTTGGAPLWSRDVSPALDGRGEASGGGLAVAGGTLFVATGFGDLIALDVATGGERWIQDLEAPGGSAPTVLGDLVYVVARDSRAWAIEAGNGRVRWQLDGTPSPTSFSGGAGAAATPDIVLFPFPSGEVLAAFPEGGLQRWISVVAGARIGQAGSLAASDISADPVIDGDIAYVGNVSGRVAALRIDTGERLWTAPEGATSPVLPVAGSVFLMNDLNQLVRLDAASGQPIWRVQLPLTQERRYSRRAVRFVHYGPVLAGGRLIVASSDGLLRQFDPVSGASLGDVALPGGAASAPAVAGGVLYVVTSDGQLTAFR